jgi:uncharacterized protein
MRFILTDELGRLSKWLRILGYDTMMEKDKAAVVIKSLREDRVILTRDSKMSRFSGVRMVKIKSDFVEEQLAQAIKELDLEIDKDRLFSLCVLCDNDLVAVKKEEVKDKVPEYVYESQDLFMRCPACGRLYWRGSHWELVKKFLDRIS